MHDISFKCTLASFNSAKHSKKMQNFQERKNIFHTKSDIDNMNNSATRLQKKKLNILRTMDRND